MKRRQGSEPQSSVICGIVLVVLVLAVVWIYAALVAITASSPSLRRQYIAGEGSDLTAGLVSGAELALQEAGKEESEPFYMIPPERRPPLQEPPADERYLPYEKLYDVVKRWSPDDAEAPADFQERLQHFNYGDPYERSLAEKWRNAELPFKVYNVTDFHEVSRRWTDGYLIKNIEQCPRQAHVERSENNHFMFWSGRPARVRNWKPPTEIITGMTYADWLKLARHADRVKLSNSSEHYYFVMGADAHEHGRTFISRDIPMFSTEQNNFWISNVAANKGIQCRFGMRGVVAASHYDAGKNFVGMIRGAKRYVLNPPRSCRYLSIIPDTRHPSYRHSEIDWSDLAQAKKSNFDQVDALDTILHKGELLYIPSYWFHYIVSLNYSIQCNSRSGSPPGKLGWSHIQACLEARKRGM